MERPASGVSDGAPDRSTGDNQPKEGAISTSDTCRRAAEAALSRKAEDLAVLDVRGLVSYCDYFVICNVTNPRQAHAVTDAVVKQAEAAGAPVLGVEGLETCRWVLIDLGDVLVHVFDEHTRIFYDLDGLWGDAPRLAVEEAGDGPAMEASV